MVEHTVSVSEDVSLICNGHPVLHFSSKVVQLDGDCAWAYNGATIFTLGHVFAKKIVLNCHQLIIQLGKYCFKH